MASQKWTQDDISRTKSCRNTWFFVFCWLDGMETIGNGGGWLLCTNQLLKRDHHPENDECRNVLYQPSIAICGYLSKKRPSNIVKSSRNVSDTVRKLFWMINHCNPSLWKCKFPESVSFLIAWSLEMPREIDVGKSEIQKYFEISNQKQSRYGRAKYGWNWSRHLVRTDPNTFLSSKKIEPYGT